MPSDVTSPPISVPDLERVAVLGWRAPDRGRIGDWLLRAADGFTGRANSALAVGDPGLPLPAAVDRACRWYATRGLPPMIAVPFPLDGPGGSDVDSYLAGCGWGIRPGAATVMTALPGVVARGAVLTASGSAAQARGLSIELAAEPGEAWLSRYHYRGKELPAAALTLLLSAPWQAFASARAGGHTLAVGRVAAGGGWAGLTAVEVDPACRRRGLGTAVTAALAAAAAAHGATGLYLQVEDENMAARALYRQAGFADHHRYHYRVAPA